MSGLFYAHVIRAVLEQPWAIRPEKLEAIVAFLAVRAAGGSADPAAAAFVFGGAKPAGAARIGTVAVIPILGTISHRASLLEDSSGGTSTEAIGRQLREAMADTSVRSIVLDVNSPGGGVHGVEELGDQIRAARDAKRIVAVANAEAGSAAYWIAAQATELVVIPSGRVGSIGVFAAHEDLSKALEAEGVKVTLVSAGKHKVEGNPFEPLSDDARAAIQERVSVYYDRFVRAVAKGRGVTPAAVRGGFGEGRMVLADQARELGMVDRVATLDQVLEREQRAPKQGNNMRAASDDELRAAAADIRKITRRNP